MILDSGRSEWVNDIPSEMEVWRVFHTLFSKLLQQPIKFVNIMKPETLIIFGVASDHA